MSDTEKDKEQELRSLKEVHANLLAEKESAKTIDQYFDDYVNADDFVQVHIEESEYPDDATDAEKEDMLREVNMRKFLLHMLALCELPQKVALAIQRAGSVGKLERIALSVHPNTEFRRIHTKLVTVKKAGSIFAQFRKDLHAIVEALKERGEIVDLEDGEIVDGKFIAKEAIERLKEEKGINVILPYARDGPANQWMANLRKAAQESATLVSEGVPVDGEHDTAHENAQKEAIVTAAAALSLYEREKPVITRSDGDHLMAVSFNWDDFYANCKKFGYDVVDFRSQTVLQEPLVAEFYRATVGDAQKRGFEGRARVMQVMANTPVLDCAVFVPRFLVGPVMRKPQPRVVHYSHVYRAYVAAEMALKSVKAAPSQRELDRSNAEAQREILKAQKALGKSAVELPKSWSKSLPAHTTRTPSREIVDNAVEQLRTAALDEWHRQVDALRAYYRNEVRYRNGEMNEAEMQLIGFKPRTASNDEAQQLSCEQLFYKGLWSAVQNLCIGLLHSQEIGILMQLQRNFPIEMREHFMTSRELPDTRRTSPATVERIHRVNEHLCLTRCDQTAQWHANGVAHSRYDQACAPFKTEEKSGKRSLADCVTHEQKPTVPKKLRSVVVAPEEDQLAPPVPDELLDQNVDPNQAHSPTMRQMRQYYCDIAVLFDLAPAQIEYIRGMGNAKKSRK